MKNIDFRWSPCHSAAATILILFGLAIAGCDDLAGAAMEYGLEKGSADDSNRNSMLAHLKAERAQCPLKINDHTTLKNVSLRGVNRIKYLYEVSESGRPEVNMNNQSEITQQVVQRTASTPLGATIVEMDLGVDHFFEDADGKCMLWLQLTKKDFESVETVKPEPVVETQPVAEPEPAAEATTVSTVKAWLPEQFNDAFRSEENPAGVQSNPYVK